MLKWLEFGASIRAVFAARLSSCLPTEDMALSKRLSRSHEIELAHGQPLGKEPPLVDTKAVAMADSSTQFALAFSWSQYHRVTERKQDPAAKNLYL